MGRQLESRSPLLVCPDITLLLARVRAVLVAVALLLALDLYKLAVDTMYVEQLVEPLELLVPLYLDLECLVDL